VDQEVEVGDSQSQVNEVHNEEMFILDSNMNVNAHEYLLDIEEVDHTERKFEMGQCPLNF